MDKGIGWSGTAPGFMWASVGWGRLVRPLRGVDVVIWSFSFSLNTQVGKAWVQHFILFTGLLKKIWESFLRKPLLPISVYNPSPREEGNKERKAKETYWSLRNES